MAFELLAKPVPSKVTVHGLSCVCCLNIKRGSIMQAAPPRTYTVHEGEDGWDTIQDAQNAAALFALFSVCLTCTCCLHPVLTGHQLATARACLLPMLE